MSNPRRDRKGVFVSSLADRRSTLQRLQQLRTDVLSKLNGLLERQHDVEQQECKRLVEQRQLELASAAAAQKQSECAKVREAAESQRRSNQSRRAAISSKAAQLTTARLSVAPLVLPQELRTHEMAVLHAWLGLLGEQRHKVSQLLEILPLRVAGLRCAPPAHIHVPSGSGTPAGGSGALVGATGLSPPSTARASTASLQDSSGWPGSLAAAFGSGRQPGGLVSRVSGDGTAYMQQGGAPAPTMAHAGGGISVSLCGLRLPDSLVGAQSAQQAQALCAVLGYALLLLDLAAAYLGAPLLHEGSFQGSTSVVWQQQTFWNRRPANSHAVLPLFMEPGLVAAAVAPLALTAKAGKSSAASGWAALPLVRALTSQSSGSQQSGASSSAGGLTSFLSVDSSMSSAGSFSEGSASGTPMDRKHADLKMAFEMMQRSCLCLVRHCGASMSQAQGRDMLHSRTGHSSSSSMSGMRLPGMSHGPRGLGPAGAAPTHGTGADGLPLPLSWSAWGCLVVLCAAVLQEEVDSAPATSVASKLGGVLPAAQLAVRAESATPYTWPVPLVPSGTTHEEMADDEGWDVVHTVLPPPPSSSSEDVEHYARAMGLEGGAQQPGSGQASLMSPLTRALSLRSGGNGSGSGRASGGGMIVGSPGGGGDQPGAIGPPQLSTGGSTPLGLTRLGSLLRGNPSQK